MPRIRAGQLAKAMLFGAIGTLLGVSINAALDYARQDWANPVGIAVVAVLASASAIIPLLSDVRIRKQIRNRIEDPSSAVRAKTSDEVWRLREFIFRRREAEEEVKHYLPANPRQAKRLINHIRLFNLIAEDRGIFGGVPELTHRHLAKWVAISEQWSGLASALTAQPTSMEALERAASTTELGSVLADLGSDLPATKELFAVLHSGVALAPTLDRLVRFQPPMERGSAVLKASQEDTIEINPE